MASGMVELIRSRCYWQTVIQPDQFQQDRIENYGRLFPIVSESAVSLRGWEFPLVAGQLEQRTAGDDWVGVELSPFGGHSIIGHVMSMRRCSYAPQQAGVSF